MGNSPDARRENTLAGTRVLIVEDDALLLLDLEEVLRQAGAQSVHTCCALSRKRSAAPRRNDSMPPLSMSASAATASHRLRGSWSPAAHPLSSTPASLATTGSWRNA